MIQINRSHLNQIQVFCNSLKINGVFYVSVGKIYMHIKRQANSVILVRVDEAFEDIVDVRGLLYCKSPEHRQKM